MLGICKLRNRVQTYAWGSRTGIAGLLGREPSDEPQAELWMGAHPKAPSEIEIDGCWVSLVEVIREAPQEVLGPRVTALYEQREPERTARASPQDRAAPGTSPECRWGEIDKKDAGSLPFYPHRRNSPLDPSPTPGSGPTPGRSHPLCVKKAAGSPMAHGFSRGAASGQAVA